MAVARYTHATVKNKTIRPVHDPAQLYSSFERGYAGNIWWHYVSMFQSWQYVPKLAICSKAGNMFQSKCNHFELIQRCLGVYWSLGVYWWRRWVPNCKFKLFGVCLLTIFHTWLKHKNCCPIARLPNLHRQINESASTDYRIAWSFIL